MSSAWWVGLHSGETNLQRNDGTLAMGLRSSRSKSDKSVWQVMSPEIESQVARNAELCGSNFYHA